MPEYLRLLDQLILFLIQSGITNIEQITKEHLTAYQKEIFYRLNNKGQQNLPQSNNNHLKAIKSFFYFLKDEGYLANNPARDLQYAKEPQQLPKTILTLKEIKTLLKQPDIHIPLGYRNRTILELLYSTGIRRQELLELKPQDVDYERGFLRVNRGKGAKDRVVPIGKIACKYLEGYIKLVRIDQARIKQEPYLFLSARNNKLSRSALLTMINKYAKKAKINKKISPHVFRHTCATHLIQSKANIRCVQEILGHAFLDTTQKYIQLTITDLKEAHEKCHPRERDANY